MHCWWLSREVTWVPPDFFFGLLSSIFNFHIIFVIFSIFFIHHCIVNIWRWGGVEIYSGDMNNRYCSLSKCSIYCSGHLTLLRYLRYYCQVYFEEAFDKLTMFPESDASAVDSQWCVHWCIHSLFVVNLPMAMLQLTNWKSAAITLSFASFGSCWRLLTSVCISISAGKVKPVK